MTNSNNNISKEEAMNEYLSKRRENDKKTGFIRSIFQVLASNFCAGLFIYFIFTSEFDITLAIVALICTLFAIGIDWAFYTMYIKK